MTGVDDDGSSGTLRGSAGRKRVLAVVGLVAIAAQFALAYLYVGLVIVTVPESGFFAFWAAWGVGLVLVLWLAARRSWTAALVPVVWLGAFIVLWLAGEAFLGWGP
ncbi:MAG: hypothetical protein M3395_00125 [Chloroflexota bacterium]|nr:hypothetical protein [Chloroflexota bacterium]